MERNTGKRWQNGVVPEEFKAYEEASKEVFAQESGLKLPEEINFFYNQQLRVGDGYVWVSGDPSVDHVFCLAERIKGSDVRFKTFVHELAHLAQAIVKFATSGPVPAQTVYARGSSLGHGEDFERWYKLFCAACAIEG